MAGSKNGLTPAKTTLAFFKKGTCSETLCHLMSREFGHSLEQEVKASMPLAGGIMQHGYQCGMFWGATLAAGAQSYHIHGPGPKAEAAAIRAAQKLGASLSANYKSINCFEITEMRMQSSWDIFKFLVKGGPIGCFRMAAGYAPKAFIEINTAMSEQQQEIPTFPVSCTSLLAKKLGLSDLHRTMVSGFAGGIGLSGGGCGALGTAIWIIELDTAGREKGKVDFKDPRGHAVIEMFLKSSDYEFECSKICGRQFEDTGSHARYLQEGGCADRIDMLAECVAKYVSEESPVRNGNHPI